MKPKLITMSRTTLKPIYGLKNQENHMDLQSGTMSLDYYTIDKSFLEVFDGLHIFSYCFITSIKKWYLQAIS